MKTASSHLFDLIHSLDKSEKRFVKLFAASENRKRVYVKLFDLIAAQTTYDEKALRSALNIKANTFSVQKKYLYDLILNRMSTLRSSGTADIRKHITQAEFLYHKGLYAQEKKVLEKARKSAMLLGENNYLQEILNMEYWLAWKDTDIQEAEMLLREKEKLALVQNTEHEYHKLEGALTLAINRLQGDEEPKLSGLRKIIAHPLLKKDPSDLSFRSQMAHYNILCSFHTVAGDLPAAYSFAKKMVHLYQATPVQAQNKAVSYLIVVNNLIHLCNELEKYDEIRKYLDLLAGQGKFLSSEHERAWAFFTFHHTELMYIARTKNFAEGIAVVERTHRALKDEGGKLDFLQLTMLRFQMAGILFSAGKFNASLQILNKLINEDASLRVRPDLKSAIRILYLLSHYEKGQMDVVYKTAKYEQRQHGSGRAMYRFEKVILDFFISMSKTATKQSGKENREHRPVANFRQLKADLAALENDINENLPMKSLDLAGWMESKIQEARK